LDRRRLVGHRTGRCCPARRRPVHPGRGTCRHRRCAVRVRPGLGDVGGALGPVHRAAAAMGGGAGAVHGRGGLLLVGGGAPVDQVLNWVWPPAMLALVVWMVVCVHRQLQRRGGRWLLYPVIAVLALASIGGGYQTLCSSRCQGLPDAWAIDRRGRTPPAPELHRRRHAHRGAGAGRWRDVVESWVDRAGRRPGDPGLRL
jgi:hypothetical protein